MVAPGSLVLEKTVIPTGQLWSGVPAKFLRNLTEEEQKTITLNAENIFELAKVHEEETSKEFQVLQKEIEEVEYKDDKLKQYVYMGPKSKFFFKNSEVEEPNI
jgi:hypothetical protein